jgi:23S rRNA (guanosine2251-2'-O)-methyltransferase
MRPPRPSEGRTAAATIVYGRNPVRELFRGRRRALRAWKLADTRIDLPAGLAVAVVDRAELERVCGSPEHQGIACETEPYPYADAAALLESESTVLMALDEIQDPHNLGAICRSAECAGAGGVVIPQRRSADVTAAVCRASAGAVEHLPVARVRNLADFLESAKRAGAWVYGADASAATDYRGPDYSGRTVFVLGAEGRGLRPRVRQACDDLVALPLRGRIESLNVSAAAAVLLYEALGRPGASGRFENSLPSP